MVLSGARDWMGTEGRAGSNLLRPKSARGAQSGEAGQELLLRRRIGRSVESRERSLSGSRGNRARASQFGRSSARGWHPYGDLLVRLRRRYSVARSPVCLAVLIACALWA